MLHHKLDKAKLSPAQAVTPVNRMNVQESMKNKAEDKQKKLGLNNSRSNKNLKPQSNEPDNRHSRKQKQPREKNNVGNKKQPGGQKQINFVFG